MIIDLQGSDGNAFALMGIVKQVARATKMDADKAQAILDDMMSGDYHHPLDVMDENFPALFEWKNDPREEG